MMQTMLVILVAVSASWAHPLYACASCGSGGDDPMVLYPGENWKAYIGMARTGDIESIDQSGQVAASYQPTARNTTTVAIGRAFSQRIFATATANYIVNRRNDYDRSAWGDPLATARYTLVQQTLADEWIPQVQILASYRPGQATSKYDQVDPAGLDVFGSGLPEGRLGLDLWHGMYDWKGGIAQTVTVPVGARQTDFGLVRPGITFRSTASVGRNMGEKVKVTGGINRDQVTKTNIDNVAQDESDTVSYGLFGAVDLTVERLSNVRFTWTKSSAVFANRNSVRSQTFAMAVMRSF